MQFPRYCFHQGFWPCEEFIFGLWVLHFCSLRLSEAIWNQSLGNHWFRLWLVTCSQQSHYLNQCWFVLNWTVRNKIQWNTLQTFHSRIWISKRLQNGDHFVYVSMCWNKPGLVPVSACASCGISVSHWGPDKKERERLSLSAFLRTEDTGVHIVHISRVIITYTLE